MPFSGASDPNLPSNITDLSVEKRRQWVGAWNGRFAQCQDDGGSADDCESIAFAVANAAIKGTDGKYRRRKKKGADVDDQRPELEDGEKFMEVYDIFDRQVNQEDAAYSPAGGLNGDPCAVCRWFIPPDNCVVVANWPEAISSIGTSNRFEARPVPEVDPVPVMIVDGEASLSEKVLRVPAQIIDTVADFARGLASHDDIKAIGNEDAIQLYKMKDGTLRWFVWASNKWEDREGEIFEESAHKEFIEYLDNGGNYPEAWVWHTPGTRWGVADWADYSDGFLMYSGTVDAGMEDVAIKIANTKGLGVSHGFKYLYSDEKNGIIGWYRDYEISTLPLDRAANLWTGIEFIAEEAKAMKFTEARRTHLVGFFGEEKVKFFETKTTGVKTIIEQAGLKWKEGPEYGEEDAEGFAKSQSSDATASAAAEDNPPGNTPAEGTPEGFDYAKMAEASVKAMAESEPFQEIGTKVKIFGDRLSVLETDVATLKASDDEKVAATFAPKVTPNTGHRASAEDGNVSDQGEGNDEARDDKRGPIDSNFRDSFFGQPEEARV